MTAEKRQGYTPEQMEKAGQIVQLLSGIPESKQGTVIMMGNAFISGMKVGMLYQGKNPGQVQA